MATVTSRRAPADKKTLLERRKLADELLGIHQRLAADFARMEILEASLKAIATEAVDSFGEMWPKRGEVRVAPGHEAEFKGDVPQVQTEAWLALPALERKRHEKSGLIKVEPQWGKKSSGRVTVKVF